MAKNKWQCKLSNNEYQYIINTTAERIKNLVFEKSEVYAKWTLDEMGGKKLFKKVKGTDKIEIEINIGLVGNDLIEILGGYERMNK